MMHSKTSDRVVGSSSRPNRYFVYPNGNGTSCSQLGELVVNGGFEERGDHLWGWQADAGVDCFSSNEDGTHQGFTAARLGLSNLRALLQQDIPVNSTGVYYRLLFFLKGGGDNCNAPIWTRITFLDASKSSLACGLDIMVDEFSLYSKLYTAVHNITTLPSPKETRYIRLEWEIDASEHTEGYVALDDVSLSCL